MSEGMSAERLERLAGLAKLPCTCTNADCENYASALTAQEAQELAAEAKRARAALAEMTRCRDNALAYAERQHVPIELDDEVDTDGEELASRVAGELLGPGWDWDDDRTPGMLARTAVAVIRPHLARLTDQAQQARARLDEIGETREEWAVRWLTAGGRYAYEPCDDEQEAREGDPGDGLHEVVKRTAGEWREVPDA